MDFIVGIKQKISIKKNIMSLKNSYVTSDYMEWDSMLSLVRKLYRDKEYRLSLLIGCGSFFGLRISDILSLTWSMLLDDEKFVIIEKKTGKRREIKVNTNFQKHIADCYAALKIMDKMKVASLVAKGRYIVRRESMFCLNQ
jgi:integrase